MAEISQSVGEQTGSDLAKDAGLKHIDQMAVLLDTVLPKHIHYVLFKCGTLVMIKPEMARSMDPIFDSFDDWDYPEHRFHVPADLRQVDQQNREYLARFLEDSEVSQREKEYFQLGLWYLQKVGYAYPGGPRSDRDVDTPIPVESIVRDFELSAAQRKELAGFRDLVFCSWPACPGMFNHYLTGQDDPAMNLATASSVLSDLQRYDYIFPRFHCIRVGTGERGNLSKQERKQISVDELD